MIRPEKQKKLRELMGKLGIREEDLEEKFLAPGSKGGQKANKTACLVHLKHLPTGLEVRSSKSRLREDNRFFARRLITEKIQEMETGTSPRLVKLAKIKKQKKRRRKKALTTKTIKG
ncbi:MAG: peptide chain release factor-like protein [Fibrobacteria bacterium]|nr:peptide chain release factor-like protein [Fibrobacteria bacterium]